MKRRHWHLRQPISLESIEQGKMAAMTIKERLAAVITMVTLLAAMLEVFMVWRQGQQSPLSSYMTFGSSLESNSGMSTIKSASYQDEEGAQTAEHHHHQTKPPFQTLPASNTVCGG